LVYILFSTKNRINKDIRPLSKKGGNGIVCGDEKALSGIWFVEVAIIVNKVVFFLYEINGRGGAKRDRFIGSLIARIGLSIVTQLAQCFSDSYIRFLLIFIRRVRADSVFVF